MIFLYLIIFITYLLICIYLLYYYIIYRTIWDKIFTYDIICNTIKESILCPIHFILWIPFIDFKSNICSEYIHNLNKNKLKLKSILYTILNNIKNILNIDNIDFISKQLWILEGTLKEFDKMYSENAEYYYKLTNSYNKLIKTNNNNIQLSLEYLVFIDQNIENCDNIINILRTITTISESGYMLALLTELNNDIKIYKIKYMILIYA